MFTIYDGGHQFHTYLYCNYFSKNLKTRVHKFSCRQPVVNLLRSVVSRSTVIKEGSPLIGTGLNTPRGTGSGTLSMLISVE